MRLTCPNCEALYEVEDSAIPPTGRDVQCSNCGHAWFQLHPDSLEGDVEEAAVHGEAPAEPETQDEAPVEDVDTDTPIGRSPRRIDENVLAILREEAARETEARKRESTALETQPDLGLAEAPAPSVAAVGADRAPRQRDLLPDIEEINSTLRPGAESRGEAGREFEEVAAQRRNGFRTGFILVVSLAFVLTVLYLAAGRIGMMVPALKGVMTFYVGAVDGFRIWLDGAVQSAVGAVRALSGQDG